MRLTECFSAVMLFARAGRRAAAKALAAAAMLASFVTPFCRAQTANDVSVLGVCNMTKSSTGTVVSGDNAGTQSNQSSGNGLGESAEYEHWWSQNGVVIGFTRTPTNSVLLVGNSQGVNWQPIPGNSLFVSPDGRDVKWPLTRNEFNTLYARRFRTRARISPHIMGGLTSIVLNGGKASGLDHQFAAVIGAGNDYQLSPRLALRCEFLTNFLRASNFSDTTYAPCRTVMFETKVGLLWRLGPLHHK